MTADRSGPQRLADRLRSSPAGHLLDSTLARGAGVAFAAQVLGVAASYVLHVFLARWMGATSYGVYTLALAYATTLAIFATLGLDAAALRFVAEYRSRGEPVLLRRMVATSWRVTLGTSLVMAAVAAAVVLHSSLAHAAELALGMALIPPLALLSLQSEAARGLERIPLSQLPMRFARPVLLLALVAPVWALQRHLSPRRALLLTLGALVAITLLQLVLLRRALRRRPAAPAPETGPHLVSRLGPHLKTWLRVAMPLVLATSFVTLLNQLDLLMVGFFRGPTEVGRYNAAVKVATLVTFVTFAINTAAAPRFAALHFQGERGRLQRMLSTLVHWAFWPSLLLAAVLMVAASPILALFGPSFPSARWELRILAGGHLFSAGVGAVGYLLNQTGHERDNARVLTGSLIVGLVLNLALVPPFGSLGAACATAVTWALLMLGLHRAVVRRLHLHPSLLGAVWRRPGA